LRVATGGVSSQSFSTVLQVSSIANGGTNSSLGSSPNDSSQLVFNGGTLRFVGAASGDTDRLFTVGSFGATIDASGSVPLHFTNPDAHSSTGIVNRTFTLTGSNAGNNTIAGTLSDAGVSALLSVNKTGTGEWVLTGNNTFTGGLAVSSGTLIAGHPNAIGNTSVLVASGMLQFQPNLSTAAKVTALTIQGGAVDMTNNDMVIDYTAPAPNPALATTIRQHLSAGRIITSSGTATTRVGYGDNAVLGKTTFGGLSVDTSSMLIKYTYAGDADLDGDADGVDIGTWATNFTGELGGTGSMVWTQGDWDYDGDVDGVDAGLWAQAFTGELGGGGLGSVIVNDPNIAPGAAAILEGMGITVVPEPATLALIIAAGAVALPSRRRRA
jgi:autotransporter-associated beta strand protein